MWTYRVKDSKTNALVLEVSPSSPVAQPRAEPPVGLTGIDKEVRILQARGDGVVGDVANRPRTIDLAVIVSATDAASYVAVRQQLRDAFTRDDTCYLEIVTPQVTARTSPFVCTQIHETPTGPFACEMTFRLLLPTPDLMIYGATQTLSTNQTTVTFAKNVVWDLQNAVNSGLPGFPAGTPQWVVEYGGDIWLLMAGGTVSRWNASNLNFVGTTSVGLDSYQLFVFNNQLFARTSNSLRRWTGSAWVPWGPVFANGVLASTYVAGDRLLVPGSFTSPQKYYVELDANGGVVSPPLFTSATTGFLSAVWGGEGMRLYGGSVDGVDGVWCGRAGLDPIQVAVSDSTALSFAGSSFARVYMSTMGVLINGAPSGRLVSIRYGQSFAPVGEGLARTPRFLVESGGDIYIPCFQAYDIGALYRIHRGGLQVLATSNNQINCVAYLPYHKRLVIVGEFDRISKLNAITPDSSPPHSGWAMETAAPLLSVWREYGEDCWSADLSQPVPARTYITPSRSINHGSGTDWRTHRKYTPSGAKLYMTYRHETTGQLQPVYLRDGI